VMAAPVLATLWLLAGPAGGGGGEAEAHTECLAGHVERGVKLLAELYVGTGDPNHIYNQGRCFEGNARWAEAVSRFREYLRVARDLTATDEVEAQRHIRECEQHLAPPPAVMVPARPDRPRPLETRSPRASYVLLGVGAFSVAVGAASGLAVRSLESSVERQWSDSRHRWGGRLEVVQWGAYIAGGLCIAGGAVLYLVPAERGGATMALRGSF
jgi:hypothetical protein